MDIKDDLVSKIFSVQRLLVEHMKKSPEAARFSLVQLKTLRFINDHDHPTMKGIADFLCVMPPSATAIVDRLIAEKFVTRAADSKDRRLVRLSITDLGRRELEAGFAQVGATMKGILDRLSPEEQQTLSAIFDKLLS